MQNSELVTVEQKQNQVTTQRGIDWTPDKVELVKNTIAKGATDNELQLFMHVCNRTGLDPFAKQIYAIKRGKGENEQMTIQTSVDGLRLVAERSGKFNGWDGPYYCGNDGKWVDVWLKEEFPRAAKFGVYKKGIDKPLYAVANWDSYVQQFYDQKKNQWIIGKFWKQMPEVMLGKCAESLALRRAFPQELSGLYTKEEMSQADGIEPPQVDHKTTTKPPQQSQGSLSEKQLKRLFAICKENEWTNEQVKDFMDERYGIASSKDLMRDQYDDLIEHVQAYDFDEALKKHMEEVRKGVVHDPNQDRESNA